MDTSLLTSIKKVHKHIIYCAHLIVEQFVKHQSFNKPAAEELLQSARQLENLVPEDAKPMWLNHLIDNFNNAQLSPGVRPNNVSEFTTFLLSNFHIIENPILTLDEVNYDFDRAFNDIRDENEIPQTFETLIEKLEAIIAADLIDSRIVQQALERLKSLLTRNKHGSLTSILVSLHYGRFLLKAFSGALSANKYLKPLLSAFKEEFATAEAKVQRSEASLKEVAIRRLTNEDRLKIYLTQNGADVSFVSDYIELKDIQEDAPENTDSNTNKDLK